jgi:hypothetical protein
MEGKKSLGYYLLVKDLHHLVLYAQGVHVDGRLERECHRLLRRYSRAAG